MNKTKYKHKEKNTHGKIHSSVISDIFSFLDVNYYCHKKFSCL